MKILVTDYGTLTQSGDVSLDVFNKFGEAKMIENIEPDKLLEEVRDIDAILCNKTRINKAVMDAAPNLKFIGLFATGYNNIDIEDAKEHGITVCNAGNYSTNAVAQQTFAFILSHFNRIAEYDALVKSGEWQKSTTFSMLGQPTDEIAGKTIGIVGYGSIGKRVANLALAFDMNVLVYNRSPKTDDRVTFVSFDELLKKSDIITAHCPLNPESKNMFNKESFRKMKDGAFFINTARGGLVVEQDLRDELDSGRISAAVDVLRREPMREDCPLKNAPNLIITPHTGWAPRTTRQRLIDIVVSNIENYLNGTPINVVS